MSYSEDRQLVKIIREICQENNIALKEFADLMEKRGYTYQKMEITFWNDDFIKSIYKLSDVGQFNALSNLSFESEFLSERFYRLCDC